MHEKVVNMLKDYKDILCNEHLKKRPVIYSHVAEQIEIYEILKKVRRYLNDSYTFGIVHRLNFHSTN